MSRDSEQAERLTAQVTTQSEVQATIRAEMQAEMQAEIAFQGDSIRALNDALAMQQQDLLLCRRQIDLLSQQLRALRNDRGEGGSGDESMPPAGERPPHY